MNYLQYTIHTPTPTQAEIITADLADLEFESFTDFDPVEQTFEAYIPKGMLTSSVDDYLDQQTILYECVEIEQQNWNAQWESDFSPIEVDERCYIRATFHEPKASEYEIVITPKMSFGTGHHPTTHLMVQSMLDTDFSGLQGLDMGSGTGILAILAIKLGAVQVDAVDIDEWAYENCIENISLNNASTAICPILGDATAITGRHYDFILANINRNILLCDMPSYATTLRGGGMLTVSGILEADIDHITNKANELKLSLSKTLTRNGWACIQFKK